MTILDKESGMYVPSRRIIHPRGINPRMEQRRFASQQQVMIAQKIASGGFPDYTTNMVLQLIGDTAGAGILTSWPADAGGNGTATGTPTGVTNALNGHTAVRFNGTTDYFQGGSISISGTSMVCFGVAALNNTSADYGRVLSLGVAGVDDFNNTLYADAISRRATSQAMTCYRNAVEAIGNITYGTFAVLEILFDGTNATFYVNGIAGTPQSSSGTFGITNYGIGNQVKPDSAFVSADITEVRAYSTDIGGTNRSTVRQFLGNKYGITITP